MNAGQGGRERTLPKQARRLTGRTVRGGSPRGRTPRGQLRNQVREARLRLGLSQQQLAQAADVTRQTIGGIEAGRYVPSVAVAMRLARALGGEVEDLFWVEGGADTVTAHLCRLGVEELAAPGGRLRVSLARVSGRWVAYPLRGDAAFSPEVTPADGLVAALPAEGAASTVQVELLDDRDALARTVVVAGCAPVLGLWARAAERWHRGLRVRWLPANSLQALQALAAEEVHIAGMHLLDPGSGEFNLPFVRRALPGQEVRLVRLGVWQEGLALAPGNPRGIRHVRDLARPGIRIVNREPGAGSRATLEAALRQAGVDSAAVGGFDREAAGHIAVAREVAAGRVDAGVVPESVAAAFGLDFLPLRAVPYDLAVRKELLDENTPVRQFLATLGHRRVRAQLQLLGGYDTAATGELVDAPSGP